VTYPQLTPLNGTKTHPLSKHALEVIERLRLGPLPRTEINPGVWNRLLREPDLVEEVWLPSPYKTVRGNVLFLKLKEAS